MIVRRQQATLLAARERFPVVGLVGARQVGKTTLARSVLQKVGGAVYLDPERPCDRARLTDLELYLKPQADRLVIIDEVQRMPELFPVLFSLVDDDRRPGRFLILGSAAPDLSRHAAESLAAVWGITNWRL